MSGFSRWVALALISLLPANAALAQETTGAASAQAGAPAPGKTAAAPPAAPAIPAWQEKWLAFSTRAFTARWGWMALFDGIAMTQDRVNEEQVGPVPAKGEPRADRLLLAGVLKFRKPWKYIIGTNFNGLDAEPGKRFSWLDLAVEIPLTSWLGNVNIGRQKVGVSQEWMMPGTDWVFMERSGMANAFIPQRNIGLRLHRPFANGRATYSAGVFNDWFVNDRSLSENGNQYTGRVSFMPIDRDEGRTVVNVATAVYFKEDTEGKLKYRSRPESNQAPYFVDTESFAGKHSTTTQFEVMGIKGPSQLFGELMVTSVKAPTVGNPRFYGGFVGASHFLTGEHRGFNRTEGYYQRAAPRSPFSFRNGGLGAWEVAARYSHVDLTDQTIDGGTMSRLTGALSWYPNTYWRFEFNYGYGILDRGGTQGHFNIFQGRAQVGF